MTAPATKRQPPLSAASAQQAQDHRQAYHRRKTRAKLKTVLSASLSHLLSQDPLAMTRSQAKGEA